MVEQQGILNKYIVTKTDGSPVDPNARYFVLRIDTDEAARSAALTYATAIEAADPVLADQLRQLVRQCAFGCRSKWIAGQDNFECEHFEERTDLPCTMCAAYPKCKGQE